MKPTMLVSLGLVAILAFALMAGCDEKAEDPASGPAAGKTLVVFVCNADDEDIGDPASQTTVGDVTQSRNQVIVFTSEASDDRLDGTGELVVNNDTRTDGSSTGWGTMKITNDGGTWQGNWDAASGAKVNGDVYFAQNMTGTGDYEGLVCRCLGIQGAVTLGLDDSAVYTGWIEQAE